MSILKNDRLIREDKTLTRIRRQQSVCQLLVKIEKELHFELKKMALEKGISMKKIVADACRKYIEQ